MGVSIRKTISTVSKLISSGQHKIAIDLLLKYLESDPNSSHVLRTLGRAYLLDHQPDKAVVCLKKSLEITQGSSVKVKDSNLSKYQSDNFGDDDMDFIEAQTEMFSEEDYSLEFDEPTQPNANKDAQRSSNDRPLLSIGSVGTGGLKSESYKNDVQVVYRERIKISPTNNDGSPHKRNDLNGVKEEASYSIVHHADEKSSHTIPINIDDSSSAEEKNRLSRPSSDSTVETKLPSLSVDDEATERPVIDENIGTDWIDDEDFVLVENEQLFSDELFEDEQDEEALDELAPTSPPSLEEKSDELIWDNFEDLDEFDELAHRETEEEVQDDGKISREARARQIAIEVLDKSDWDLKHLSLLQQIFIENGWSAARRAIEREIGKGLWPEELSLARKIRLFWLGNEQCWMTFHKIKHNASFQQTDDAYKCMSWPESLRIIRCFQLLPDVEEIYVFIDEVFDRWYNSKNLRRVFPIFFKFLKYRVDYMRQALPGETVFSFLYYVNASSDVDGDMLNNSITPESQEILELGFQLNQWPRPPENKMKIIRESDE